MTKDKVAYNIRQGNIIMGLELGSTRIKAVLIDQKGLPLATGSYVWENSLVDGVWTYSLEEAWKGIREAYADLASAVRKNYGEPLRKIKAMGISGMMHGYLPFDASGKQLAMFRTWRNTMTEKAATILTELFDFNIPHRWSVAHLYQAVLNGEEHVEKIAFLTTLSGYVHWKLTGEKTLGICDASGMFPISSETKDYDAEMLKKFEGLLQKHGLNIRAKNILPRVLAAGEPAGVLTQEGAKLLDPTGTLLAGSIFCPPEGDAGTGMIATNSVSVRTGNISAGTSIFAMVVLEKPLSRVYPEIDIVATPTGHPVAMVHCNTCTSDIDAWIKLFMQFAIAVGGNAEKAKIYDLFYQKALEAQDNCDGIVNINYYSGEPITGISGGRPLLVRFPNSELTFANFARAQLYSAIATLKIGMDLLFEKEKVCLDVLRGHGGFFKTPRVGPMIMAGALNVPVSLLENAGEGGPWGMAILAAYRAYQKNGQPLESYLEETIFGRQTDSTYFPNKKDVQSFGAFMENYKKILSVEERAIQVY